MCVVCVFHLNSRSAVVGPVCVDTVMEDGLYACGTFRNDRMDVPRDMKDTYRATGGGWEDIDSSHGDGGTPWIHCRAHTDT